MIDVTATEEIAKDARVKANVARLAAAQALTGANSAVIFATGSIVGATRNFRSRLSSGADLTFLLPRSLCP